MTGSAVRVSRFDAGLRAQQAGQVAEAIEAYRQAIADDPALAPAHFNLGQILRAEERFADAADRFEAAASLRPSAADAWINLGLCRERLGDLDAAGAAYENAAALDDGGTSYFNLGNVRKKQGRLGQALTAYREAERRHPAAPEIQLNIGNTLRELGEPAAGAAALRRALELRPGWVEASWNLGLALLAAGHLREGWEHYESRWAHLGLRIERGLSWPLWRGEPLDGKRVLVWREQGLGDEILFATCVPDLLALGAEPTLAVDARLVALFGRAMPGVTVVSDPDWDERPFDYHVPLGTLPRLLRSERDAFPAAWSLLQPERGLIAHWRDRVAQAGDGLRVGLCWRSGLRTVDRQRHYAPLDAFAPLLGQPGVTWVNLQYDDCEAELAEVERESGVRIHRWSDLDLRNDLDGVAALLWQLDLVVSAPTAVGSLAGALGVETWQVEAGNDWTAFGEPRSPWLPAIRMFRRAPGDRAWDAVIRQVADALHERRAAGAGHAPFSNE